MRRFGPTVKRHSFSARLAAAVGAPLLALCFALAAGCGVPSLPAVQTETVDAASLTGDVIPAGRPVNMTLARWAAPANRLLDDIPRAIQRHEWAALHIEPQVDAMLPGASLPTMAISATALLPDDREAAILAWRIADHEVAVAVRVGYFGDPAAERDFLARVRQVMAGKPKPKRGGTFELP
jgi:hypothetical protein